MRRDRILLSDDLVIEIGPASSIQLNGNWIDPETAQALARLADRNRPTPQSDLALLKRLVERVKETNALLGIDAPFLEEMLEASALLLEEGIARRKLNAKT